MKKAKRLLALVMALALALTAFCIPAGAESIYDTAKAISSGKAVKVNLYNSEDTADYKITVAKDGELKLAIDSKMYAIRVYLYDSDGNELKCSSKDFSSADDYGSNGSYAYAWWNSTTERIKGTITYGVKKGTYYIRLYRRHSSGGSETTMTATYPTAAASSGSGSSTTDNSGMTLTLSLTMSKGSSVKLGALVSGGSGTVKWSSSKKSVATVSSTGKVTAKAKGTAIITVKCGSVSQKIKIIVS